MAFTVFQLPIGYRLYDREKNKIIPLQEEEYLALSRVIRKESTSGDRKILKRFQEKGFCNETSLCDIENPATASISTVIKSNVRQMVLQLTQNCNLRCSYCAYSGNYNNREHSQKRMSLETALQAVVFFVEHSTEVSEATIGFYGGEPLLEFPLIWEIVEYVSRKYPGRNIRYNLTSNLTLLTDEIIDYLVKNNISMMISIDGPQPVQDRYRVFANGKGSFSKVMENAQRLYDKAPDYFQKCMTNTVISPDGDCEAVKEFLDRDDLFGKTHSMMTRVNETGLKKPVKYGENYRQMVRKEKLKLLLAMLGEISYEKVSPLFTDTQTNIIQLNQMLRTNGTQGKSKGHPGGPCIPGKKRIFVDVEGNIYPCERIAEYPNYQIGNIFDGFDIERIKQMINVAQYTKNECLHCWAFMYCGSCIANMAGNETINPQMRLQKCYEEKNKVLSNMADMEIMKHYGLDFWRSQMAGKSGKND